MECTDRPSQSVSDLSLGQQGTICSIGGRGAIRQRLLDMGLLPGVTVEVKRVAPMGTPVWIKARGAQISLRRDEARAVCVCTC